MQSSGLLLVVSTLLITTSTSTTYLLNSMIQTDTYYACPIVCKPISMHNKAIQLDASAQLMDERHMVIDKQGYLRGTYMKVVSFVSNNAAVYPN